MSKNTISASATGLPSRRLFLASGPAAAVLMSLRKAAAEDSPLAALIERYHAAKAEYDRYGEIERGVAYSDPHFKEVDAEGFRLFNVEHDILDQICACPVKTIEEARMKAECLTWHFENFETDDHQMQALLRSFLV